MERRMIGAVEVGEALGMSRAYAYKLIRRLNNELEESGYLTIPGKVERDYFEARLFAEREGRGDVRQP